MLEAIVAVLLLGSPDFQKRELAQEWLAQHQDTAVWAIFAGENHSDPEISQRCRVLARSWVEANGDWWVETFRPPGWPYWPWLEMMTLRDSSKIGIQFKEPDWIYSYYLDAATKAGAKNDLEWTLWSKATRLLVKDLLIVRAPVHQLVRALAEDHHRQCLINGRPCPELPK